MYRDSWGESPVTRTPGSNSPACRDPRVSREQRWQPLGDGGLGCIVGREGAERSGRQCHGVWKECCTSARVKPNTKRATIICPNSLSQIGAWGLRFGERLHTLQSTVPSERLHTLQSTVPSTVYPGSEIGVKDSPWIY